MDEEVGLTYTDKYLETLASLLSIRKEDGRWVSLRGSPLGGELIDAIQQEIVRSYETVRVREKVWGSDLSQERKVKLLNVLNLVERLINMEILRDSYRGEELMEVADLIAEKVRSLYGE